MIGLAVSVIPAQVGIHVNAGMTAIKYANQSKSITPRTLAV